jgi:hypothetical protein
LSGVRFINKEILNIYMVEVSNDIYNRISHLESEFELFKELIEKESNLSDWAKKQLEISRSRFKEDFVELDDL